MPRKTGSVRFTGSEVVRSQYCSDSVGTSDVYDEFGIVSGDEAMTLWHRPMKLILMSLDAGPAVDMIFELWHKVSMKPGYQGNLITGRL